jgi:hypothetical protein
VLQILEVQFPLFQETFLLIEPYVPRGALRSAASMITLRLRARALAAFRGV